MAKKNDLLARYHAKRDFKKTDEPKGEVLRSGGFSYLIQKHAARRLHYDFRLELDGVLKSWAVTRGPSLDPHEKRLAVEVEDHPLDYGTFEGIIPAGQYGGGTVMLWDQGEWEPLGDPHKQLKAGKLTFRLHGERLQGEWSLVRMRGREKEKRTNWLLIKKSDESAIEGDGEGVLEKFSTSVVSKRRMEQIAANKEVVWNSRKKQPRAKKSQAKKVGKETGKDKMPVFIPPQLATLANEPPPGGKWVHEIKFDGYRIQAHIRQGRVKLLTRTGLDWTHKFASIAALLAELPCDSAILDGEMVAVDGEGVSSFKALQNALTEERDDTLHYYAFDALFLDGKDLTKLPLLERKTHLEALLSDAPKRIFYSEHFTADGDTFLQHACHMHLEGVISKLATARYEKGRSKGWIKSKCSKRQEFVIGGFTLPSKGKGIGALVLGYYEDGELHYAGRVGTGFTAQLSLELRQQLEKLRAMKSAFSEPLPGIARKGVQYVKPRLVCEVAYTEWTESGALRHPSFQGLREDKPAISVGKDRAAKPPAIASGSPIAGHVFSGVKISHPDKVLYPESGVTKGMVAEYYARMADAILTYAAGRPMSIVRCTSGITKACFFQRHNTIKGKDIHNVYLPDKPKEAPYLMVDSATGLLSLAQMGAIEMHGWGSRAGALDKPDRIIFDLDPDPSLGWKHVVDAAFEVKSRLEALGLQSFVQTTGGKGLHVIAPIRRQYGWDVVKPFTKAIATQMEKDEPKRFVANMSKTKRKGRIFVDYLRNGETATAVMPYTLRARPGATVATPIAWEELKAGVTPSDFNLHTVPERLATQQEDPWEGFNKIRQSIRAIDLKKFQLK